MKHMKTVISIAEHRAALSQNALLPAGLRQRDQTKKAPTGTFQRDDLLAHLEKQAKEHPDRDDLVPYTGEKRGENADRQGLPLQRCGNNIEATVEQLGS